MEKARAGFKGMLLAVVLLLSASALTACVSATSAPASAPNSATPGAPTSSREQAETPTPAPTVASKIVSFTGDADLDGDGTQETVEVGRYPLPGANVGDTYLHVRKGTQTIAYPFDELERRGYSEYVELQDVDGDGLPEILISRDIGGNGLGGGRVLKLQDNALACIFYTETQKPDIRITFADQYQLLVQSNTMRPSKAKFPLQHGEKYETVYDDNGKLINQQEAMIDPSSGMRSVPTEHSSPADIEVTQVCSGVGGHSDTLGTIQTVYRYQAQGWRIVSTTFSPAAQ